MASIPYIAAVSRLPVSLERERTQDVTLPIYVDDTLTAPSSGTVTIYDRTEDKVEDGAAVAIGVDKIAT